MIALLTASNAGAAALGDSGRVCEEGKGGDDEEEVSARMM